MKLSGFIVPMCLLALAPVRAPAAVPVLNHVIVIIMENHSYDQVHLAPYTASLIAQYSACTEMYAITHPSCPNYLTLWAGSTFGITANDCPPPGSPFTYDNLGHECEVAGRWWRSYCEDLPSVGSAVCSYSGYQRKHAPWTDFGNLDHQNEHPFTDLAADIAAGHVPALVFVVPNQCNSTHDCSVATGDDWLAAHVPAMLNVLGPHGVLILTWDEDDDAHGNHILTVFAGPAVKHGFSHTLTENHYSVLRTICDALRLPPMGAATAALPIDDIWSPESLVTRGNWGRLKATIADPAAGGALKSRPGMH